VAIVEPETDFFLALVPLIPYYLSQLEHEKLEHAGKEAHIMTRTLIGFAALLLVVLAAGCGANKDYVDSQIADAEARMSGRLDNVQNEANSNSNNIEQLQNLAQQLQDKAEMALNEAKGFENYQIIWQGDINFAFDSYQIDDVAAQILNEAGAKMTDNPGSLIEIVGHTDRTGSSEYNLRLGQERAGAAQRFLADNFGISLYRMFILSYGEQKPIALPDEKNSASRNRRVKLTVWGSLQ
jgi:peptidoglycan-associated lipoprotein